MRLARSLVRISLPVVAGLFVLVSAIHAQDSERIRSFKSHILVQPDARLIVRETIRVCATQGQIRHGIFRDFPLFYQDRKGSRRITTFEIQEVLKDGSGEKYSLEKGLTGIRVYIGDPDRLLPPGEYEYTLVYRTCGQLDFFSSRDELYWNVTGQEWAFPIDSVEAVVELPPDARRSILAHTGYTGRTGSREQAIESQAEEDGTIKFRTTRRLGVNEGLTIQTAWAKGAVQEPTASTRFGWFVCTNPCGAIGVVGCGVVLVYFLLVWILVGIDPPKGKILPQASPPDGLSPAALRYVENMAYDSKVLACALISMAMKGYLTLREEDKIITLTRTGGIRDALSPDEKEIASYLLRPQPHVTLDGQHYQKIRQTIDRLKVLLRNSYGNPYFRTNVQFLWPGMIVSILVVCMLLYSAPYLFTFGVMLLLLWINMTFHYLLKAPTRSGRRLLDKIEGFRMYLRDMIDRDLLQSPSQTKVRDFFQKYLAYTMALDVEKEWGQRVADAIASLSKGAEDDERMSAFRFLGPAGGWWSGAGHGDDLGDFYHHVSRSLSREIEGSSGPPGASSGGASGSGSGGGGGYAGGGGGGGGGGGW